MFLTVCEVKGWQIQEKTAGDMYCEPVRVREKTVVIPILLQIWKENDVAFMQKHWLSCEQKKEKSSVIKRMDWIQIWRSE